MKSEHTFFRVQHVPRVSASMPFDCHIMILQYLPSIVVERCHVCGIPVVMRDKRNRMHFEPHIVCTESVLVCGECFECFYE